MSLRNGDKARFGRQRKEKIRRRMLTRELRKALEGQAPVQGVRASSISGSKRAKG
jgi:hypothetical protein